MTSKGDFILHQTECKVANPEVAVPLLLLSITFLRVGHSRIEMRSLQHKYRCGPEVGPKGLR